MPCGGLDVVDGSLVGGSVDDGWPICCSFVVGEMLVGDLVLSSVVRRRFFFGWPVGALPFVCGERNGGGMMVEMPFSTCSVQVQSLLFPLRPSYAGSLLDSLADVGRSRNAQLTFRAWTRP